MGEIHYMMCISVIVDLGFFFSIGEIHYMMCVSVILDLGFFFVLQEYRGGRGVSVSVCEVPSLCVSG